MALRRRPLGRVLAAHRPRESDRAVAVGASQAQRRSRLARWQFERQVVFMTCTVQRDVLVAVVVAARPIRVAP